jgi:ribosome-associated protein
MSSRTKTPIDPLELAHGIVEAIAGKKGEDIVLMDLREHALFADYFVICSGSSDRQLKALVDGVTEAVRKKFNVRALHIEGTADAGWILLDMNEVIVHIFAPKQRHHYDLEGLWKEAPILLQVQ